jgi:pyridoxine/pyridoxamine 5'-phosphate oxidase
MNDPAPSRSLWWTRQYLDPYTLSEDEAWRMIEAPPWKCVVAWVTKDCKPVACEMSYAILDGQIVLTSTTNRDKVKALRRNPAISLCFTMPGLKQVTVRGHVEVSDDRARVRQWAEATVARMPSPLSAAEREREIQRYLSPDRLMLTVVIEKMLSFNGEQMFLEERAVGSGQR